MKKLFFAILMLTCFQGFSQNRFPSVDSAKTYVLRYVKNSATESFTNLRLQNVVYGTLELLDSLTAVASASGIDSIWLSSSATKDTIKYSLSGTNYTAAVLDKASLRIAIADSAAMLAGYTRLTRFTDSLLAHTTRFNAIYDSLSRHVTRLDTTRNGIRADLNGKQGALTLTTTGSSGASTLTGNTLNIPQYSGGGGGSFTWDSLRVFSVTNYGAKGDNSTNDRYAIQAAINAAKAVGGGRVYFPRGIYRIDSTLRIDTSNIQLYGQGYSSQILATSDFGNIIHIEPLAAKTLPNFQGHKIHDLYIESNVVRTTGFAIYSKYTFNFIIQDTKIGQFIAANLPKLYGGVKFVYQSSMLITSSQIFANQIGVYVDGEPGGGDLAKLHWNGMINGNTTIFGYKNGTNYTNNSYGVHIAGGNGGMQIEQSSISYYQHGVYVDKSSGYGINRELFLGHGFYADDVGGAGVVIKDSSLSILQCSGGWSAGTGKSAAQTPTSSLYIEEGLSPIVTTIAGGTSYSNSRGHAFFIGRGTVNIAGVTLYGNDSTDIKLGANVTAATIVGSRFSTFSNTSIATLPPNLVLRANSTDFVNERVTRSTNGSQSFEVENLNTGTAATAGVTVYNSSSNASFGLTSTGYTPVGVLTANTGYIVNGGANGFALSSVFGNIKFGIGASHVERMSIKTDGYVYVNNRMSLGSATSPLAALDVPGNSTNSAMARIGSIEFQSYSAVNNTFFGDNVYYDGSNFVRRAAGSGGLFYFVGVEGQFRLGATGSAGAAITLKIPFKLHEDGRVGIGGDVSTATGTYTGGTMFVNSTAVGIGTNGTAATSTLQVTGSVATTYTATATGITLSISHNVVDVTATGQTITLPAAAGITGRIYTIKLTAAGTSTVDGNGAETIDGAATYSLSAQYKYVTIQSNGSNWIIIGNN